MKDKIMSDQQMGDGPAIVVAQLYERIDRRGQTYYVGRLGSAKVYIRPTGQVDRGNPIWQMTFKDSRYVTQEQKAVAREIVEEDA